MIRRTEDRRRWRPLPFLLALALIGPLRRVEAGDAQKAGTGAPSSRDV